MEFDLVDEIWLESAIERAGSPEHLCEAILAKRGKKVRLISKYEHGLMQDLSQCEIRKGGECLT